MKLKIKCRTLDGQLKIWVEKTLCERKTNHKEIRMEGLSQRQDNHMLSQDDLVSSYLGRRTFLYENEWSWPECLEIQHNNSRPLSHQKHLNKKTYF